MWTHLLQYMTTGLSLVMFTLMTRCRAEVSILILSARKTVVAEC